MKKILSIIAITIGVTTVATLTFFYIKQKVKQEEIKEKLSETIGKDQGLMEIILKIPNAHATYGEVFDLCEKSVDERNKLIVELRGLYPNIQNDIKDSLINFLSIENDLVRDESQYTRRARNVTAIGNKMKELREEYSDYYSDNIGSLKNEYDKELQEFFESYDSFKKNYEILISEENRLNNMMAKAGLRFILLFGQYKDINLLNIPNSLNNQI